MPTPVIETLERLLAAGKDSAALRFGLGGAYLGRGDAQRARQHLERAVALDPDYSAAWKLLGRAQAQAGDIEAAVRAYEQGIAVAQSRGDVQAKKEMSVLLARLRRGSQAP